MPTVSDLINETESHLTGIVGGSYNRLAGGIDATQEAIPLEFDNGGIVEGSVIGIDTEDIFVLEVGEQSVTKCIRGFRGSTAAIHADNSIVQADPRFTRFRILSTLKQEIASWGPRLYAVDGATINLAVDTRGYALSALSGDVLHVAKAYAEPTTVFTTNSSSWPEVEFRVGNLLDSSDFSGGSAIFFNDYLYQASGRRVRVVYAKRFDVDPFTTSTDVVADVGLAVSMLDIPPLGAAWRLMISQEIRRSDAMAQGQSRRSEEVPPTAALQTANALKAMRDARIAEERLSLVAKWGWNGGF